MPFLNISRHVRWPPHLQPKRGYTGKSPDAIHVGQRAQKAMNYMLNWRFNGPQFATFLSPYAGTNDLSGAIDMILHYPPRTDSNYPERQLAIAMSRWGSTAGGAWSVTATPDALGTPGTPITIWDGAASSAKALTSTMVGTASKLAIISLDAPPGNGGSGFEVLRLTTTNQRLGGIAAWWLPTIYLSDEQLQVTSLNVGTNRIIKTTTLGTLLDLVGAGTMNIESAERLSRRCWFSWAHTSGILISGPQAKTNLFNDYTFPARTRHLTGSGSVTKCYPSAVISCEDVEGDPAFAKLYFTSGTQTWSYTIQPSEWTLGAGVKFLVTYDRTGTSDATGLQVNNTSEDDIQVDVELGAGVTMTVHSVRLDEGPYV